MSCGRWCLTFYLIFIFIPIFGRLFLPNFTHQLLLMHRSEYLEMFIISANVLPIGSVLTGMMYIWGIVIRGQVWTYTIYTYQTYENMHMVKTPPCEVVCIVIYTYNI